MKHFTKTHTVRLLGVIVLFATASMVTFSNVTYPAYLAWNELHTLENERAKIAGENISGNNVAAMKSYISKYTFAGRNEQLQQSLFHSLSFICDSLQITLNSFAAFSDVSREEAIRVITTKVTVEGDFKQILKMIYAVETTVHGSMVASVGFHSRRDLQSKSLKLSCDIHLQSILKKM